MDGEALRRLFGCAEPSSAPASRPLFDSLTSLIPIAHEADPEPGRDAALGPRAPPGLRPSLQPSIRNRTQCSRSDVASVPCNRVKLGGLVER
jgi:hypothetical protein